MKKKLLALFLVLAMTLGCAPASVYAQAPAADSEPVTVTVTMDTRVVAEDVTNYGLTALPASTQIQVPDGATVAEAMQKWASEQNVALTIDNTYGPYITEIGAFGAYGTESFNALCANAGFDPIPEIFQYAGWTYTLDGISGMGAGTDTVSDGSVVSFRYALYMASGTWQQVDHAFLDAYDAAADRIAAASSANESDYSAAQWETLQTALADAQAVKTAIDDEAFGLWMNYFADKQTALWGPGSPTDKLEKSAAAVQLAIDKIVAPTGVAFVENNVELPLNQTYSIQTVVTPEGAPQDVVYEAFLGDTAFSVSADGVITPSAKNSLCWIKVSCKDAPDKFDYFKFKIVDAIPEEEPVSIEELLHNIAATYDDDDDTGDWVIMDMGAYAKLFSSPAAAASSTAKQTYLNQIVTMLVTGKNSGGWDAGAGDYAKAILALAAIGIDPQQLYPVNNNTALSVIAYLDPAAAAATSAWTAPYILQAYHQGSYDSSAQEEALVNALLDSQKETGEWDEFGTIDTTANVIAALSLYQDRPEVRAAIDAAVAYLSSAQQSDGSFDDGQTGAYAAGKNANSTAMVIIGLAANGIDPDTDERFIKGGNSVLDGLLRYAAADSDGFGYSDKTWNALATEQGFRALIAAYGVMESGAAYNVYDFSGGTLIPGRATGVGTVTTPDDPSGMDITVTVTIKADTGYWLRDKSVAISGEGATVYHALMKALENSGITQTGAAGGYVNSMTKNGRTLAEFSSGENSGWMYKVNGELPDVGLTDCAIADGDAIVWFYTNDWTTVQGSGTFGGAVVSQKDTAAAQEVRTLIANIGNVTAQSRDVISAARAAYDALTDLQKKMVTNHSVLVLAEKQLAELTKPAFTDVADTDYFHDAVLWAVEKGITNGTTDTTFSPDAGCTRAQMVAFLWRAAGCPDSTVKDIPFADVDEDAYYYKALLWAVESGITNGTAAAAFSPDAVCTRGQMAAFLYRSAKTPAVEGAQPFADVDDTAYYSSAVIWARNEGITNGTTETTFSPDAGCTRAQMVTFLYRYLAK